MRSDRLLDIATVLEGVPDKKFDIGLFADECGSVACAVGWYCKKRPQSGLWLDDGSPRSADLEDWYAINDHFGISNSESTALFMEEGYRGEDDLTPVTRAEVIARIREFVASHS